MSGDVNSVMRSSNTTALAMMSLPTHGVMRYEGDDFIRRTPYNSMTDPTRDPPPECAGRLDRSARTARGIQYSSPWPPGAEGSWPSSLEAYLPLNRRVHQPVSSENPRESSHRASTPHVPADSTVRIPGLQRPVDRPGRSPGTSRECTCIHSRKSRAVELFPRPAVFVPPERPPSALSRARTARS